MSQEGMKRLLDKLSRALSPSPLLFLSLRKTQCSSLMCAPLSTMSWRRSASAWPTLSTSDSVSQGNSNTKSSTNNEPLSSKEYSLVPTKKVPLFLNQRLSTANFIFIDGQHQNQKPRNNDIPL